MASQQKEFVAFSQDTECDLTEREIIAGLLDAFEQYEWVYDDNPPKVCCAHGCGVKYRRHETPYEHKPGCKIEALLAAAREVREATA